jgi:glucose-1-phosphate cytidylyltransferase
VDIKKLIEFHKAHGKIATVTGVLPPSRFGELMTEGNSVKSFTEKPQIHEGGHINGGYFVFNKKFFSYLSDDANCILERSPIEKLANENQLMMYAHDGFWQCMDTYRDFEYLNALWRDEKAEWRVW